MAAFARGDPIDLGMLTGAFYISNMLQAKSMPDHATGRSIYKG
jgi:hypothetical protein